MSAKGNPPLAASLLEAARAQYATGRFDEAAASCRRLLQEDPRNAEALCQLGNALCGMGAYADAARAYSDALAAHPSSAQAQHNLGYALQNLGALVEAEQAYRCALALEPESATALASLGYVLHCLGRSREGEGYLRAALRIAPNYCDAHNNLGIVLQELGQSTAAIESFRSALILAPGAPQVHMNLASALLRAGQCEAAEAGCRRALSIKPDFAEAHYNLGVALEHMGRLSDAEQAYRKAISLQPGLSGAHTNLAFALLSRGAFREGFREYEWSVRTTWGAGYLPDPSDPARPLPRPSTRMPLDWRGKRVLLLSDQGIGDEIFFLRFAPRLRAAGARLLHRPHPKLAGLVARSGWVDEVLLPDAPLPTFDLAFATSDLATLAEAVDASAPPMPLNPLPDRVHAMRARLAAWGPPPWLGITWRAGTGYRVSEFATLLAKVIDPALLGSSLARVDARVVILQRAPAPGEREHFSAALGRSVIDLSTVNDSLEDMCALLSLLDAQAGVSNTNTHLTAALGRTARVLVPFPYDWRWMREGMESPWFPGFRLYRQHPNGDWAPALSGLADDLAAALRT